MKKLLIYLAYKYRGNNFEIWKALKNKEKINNDEFELFNKNMEQNSIKAITIYDIEYPESLRKYNDSPYVLFCKGDLNLLKNDGICLTGDINNEKIQDYLNESLPVLKQKNKTLIVGTYKDVDKEIIKYYREHKLDIIHIIPSGFDYFNQTIYSNELYISQYPDACHIKYNRLREKNCLIAKMSDFLIVYSSKIKSSIQNMVSFFVELGKEVYCYPGIYKNDGNSLLIEDGANVLKNNFKIAYF